MAAEHNLDLSAIPGTGLAGRVTKNDMLSYIEAGPADEGPRGATAPAVAAAAAPPGVPAPPAPPGPRRPSRPWHGDRVEPWSRIRKLTAEHMVMSRRVSPHVNTIFEIDYTRIAQIRARQKKEYADRGVNLTYLAFIAKAVADALRKHPGVNSAVCGESTVFRRDINLGIAVALDWGLIVPVIKHADELSLLGVARAINDLGERARTKKLSPDDVQRGTFTITNPGVFGSVIGTPIINQPQAAILCVGAIEKQPAVITVDGTTVSRSGPRACCRWPSITGSWTGRRRPLHGRREAMLQEFPEARSDVPRTLTVSRVRCVRGRRVSRGGAGAGRPARGARQASLGLPPDRPGSFLECSESRSAETHRAPPTRPRTSAARGPAPRRRRVRAGAWDLWEEVRSD